MKKTKILAGSLLAATGVLLLTPAAHAAINYQPGDLLLGFEKPGSANNYVVDIGSFDHYIGVSGTINLTTTLGLGNIAADLADPTNGFGSGWATNSNTQGTNVQWGVIGGSSTSGSLTIGTKTVVKNTLFFTQAETVFGTLSTPLTGKSNTTLNQYNLGVGGVGLVANGSTQSANSPFAVFESSTTTNSWGNSNPQGGIFGSVINVEQDVSGVNFGPTNSQLDLYEIAPPNGSAGTYLGSFTLNSSGTLFFSNPQFTAVPEPGSWSFVGVGAGLLGMLRRRRQVVVA